MAYLTAHYTGAVALPLCLAVAEFMKRRETKGTGRSQQRHLRVSIEDFAASLAHNSVELVTETEVIDWLSNWKLDAPKTWNDKRGYLHSFFCSRSKRVGQAFSPRGH